jgi:hypothetical protein
VSKPTNEEGGPGELRARLPHSTQRRSRVVTIVAVISKPFRGRLLVALLVSTLAACGGGDEDATTETTRSGDNPTTPLDTSDDTLFSLPPMPAAEFDEYPDGRVRFANFWRRDGEGSPVDIYWGTNAQSGEMIDTLEYGAVSDWYTMKTESNAFVEDPESRLRAVIQVPGIETGDGLLQMVDETLDGEHRWTVVMGWTETFNPDLPDGMTTQIVYEEEVGEAPAGQALLLLNDIGIRGLEGGDFISLDAVGTCNQEWSISNDIPIGNGGTAYPVPAGTVEFVAHDANVSDCAQAHPSDPIRLELAAGDRYLVLTWGTSVDDRSIEAFPIEP